MEDRLRCRALLYSRKGVPRTGTKEVTEVAVRLLVPGFNGNGFWEGLAKYSVLWGDAQIPCVFSISVGGCSHPWGRSSFSRPGGLEGSACTEEGGTLSLESGPF